jgi:hypothetical protein
MRTPWRAIHRPNPRWPRQLPQLRRQWRQLLLEWRRQKRQRSQRGSAAKLALTLALR